MCQHIQIFFAVDAIFIQFLDNFYATITTQWRRKLYNRDRYRNAQAATKYRMSSLENDIKIIYRISTDLSENLKLLQQSQTQEIKGILSTLESRKDRKILTRISFK